MIGIPLGLAVANAGEYYIHKHVLHGLGKRRGTFWSFHWHEHHRATRKNDHLDPAYRGSVFQWNGQGKEALALAAGAAAWTLVLPVAPFFAGTMIYCTVNYYRKHKRAHLDPGWARTHLPWHYDHHMGPDQDKNWCVTRPWFDILMGTRVPYAGTEREAKDRARRAARVHRAGRPKPDAAAAASTAPPPSAHPAPPAHPLHQ
ncbi:MAG TPA: hypothetical protein VFG83_09065 [Kofleriaceae bacterium]|nr:hypothetical protein [Kofleriaceae bacterium]